MRVLLAGEFDLLVGEVFKQNSRTSKCGGLRVGDIVQHDVAGKTLVQLRVDHRIAAKLDDDGFAGEAPDIGQRFGQNLCDIQCCGTVE